MSLTWSESPSKGGKALPWWTDSATIKTSYGSKGAFTIACWMFLGGKTGA
jgi:hypothetical protein